MIVQAFSAMIGTAFALFLVGLVAVDLWRSIFRPIVLKVLDSLLSEPRRIARRVLKKGKP